MTIAVLAETTDISEAGKSHLPCSINSQLLFQSCPTPSSRSLGAKITAPAPSFPLHLFLFFFLRFRLLAGGFNGNWRTKVSDDPVGNLWDFDSAVGDRFVTVRGGLQGLFDLCARRVLCCLWCLPLWP